MAGGHLPRSWAGSPGSILVSAASAGAGALTVIPVAAGREARKWVSACGPAVDAA
jgi:microcompartment protein CcmK/EutM